ncbi:hypothetical protein [Streptomyces sp. NPDC055085]
MSDNRRDPYADFSNYSQLENDEVASMPGPIATTGALAIFIFPPALIIPPELPLESVSNVLINDLPVMSYEALMVLISTPKEYLMPGAETPGTGTIELLDPTLFMAETVLGSEGPLATGGTVPALFTVEVPCIIDIVPDLELVKPGDVTVAADFPVLSG